MVLDEALRTMSGPFRFNRRAVDLPPDLRPDWRIATVLLLLHRCCKGGKSSLLRLHVLNWAIRSTNGRQATLAFLAQRLPADAVVVRFEPALNRALDFATAERLVAHAGDRIHLLEKGKTLVSELEAQEGLLAAEKEFVQAVGRKLTEDAVKRLVDSGGSDVAPH